MDAEEDPDPGAGAHPTLFYGLWPRFHVEEDSVDDAEPAVVLDL
jgi:hypothetical protein